MDVTKDILHQDSAVHAIHKYGHREVPSFVADSEANCHD